MVVKLVRIHEIIFMELVVTKREKFGKSTKALRKSGLVPAELYGRGIANQHLSVSVKEFSKVFKEAGENTIVNIVIGNERHPVLIYGVDVDPISGEFRNADFYKVRMDEKIQTEVPLKFIGEPPAVREYGGILIKAMHEIEVEALPMNLPKEIEIDVSPLDELGKSIYVRDLKKIEGVEFLVEPETVIATVKEHVVEEEKPAAEAVPEEGAAAAEAVPESAAGGEAPKEE